jgi:hypothetical protein
VGPFRFFEFDAATNSVIWEESNGAIHRAAFPGTRGALGTNLTRVRADFDAGELIVGLPNGNSATAELPMPGRSDATALRERRILYLDQRDWSAVAGARFGVAKANKETTEAAVRLAELVQAGKLVVPISSGHLTEADALLGKKRQPLASTMLELSRGWQMRHPLNIGKHELAAALGIESSPPARVGDVFTLDSNATFINFPTHPSPLPPPFDEIIPAISAISGTYDTMIDATSAPDEGGQAVRLAWARAHEELVQLFAKDKASPDMVRRAALGRLLLDYAEQLVRDGQLDMEFFKEWIPKARDEVPRMPYFARLWDIQYARLRGRGKWSPNDLVDIHMLAAAAGYADVVVGERRTISDLRTAKRRAPAGAELATSLPDAVALIEAQS